MPTVNPKVLSRTDVLARLRGLLEQELQSRSIGEALPPMRVLQQKAGVGRVRLERVLDELEAAGRIERRSRSGIYKAGDASTLETLSMVELVVCDYASDAHRGKWFAAAVVNAISAEAGRRELGVRFRQFQLGAPISDYQALAEQTTLRACLLLYPHVPDLAAIFESRGIRTVSIYPRILQRRATNVVLDARQFVARQIEHLWSHGHERIAYLDVMKSEPQVIDLTHLRRREAFYRLMAHRGQRVAPHWVQPADGDPAHIKSALEGVFSRPPYPTAIVVGDSQLTTVYRFIEGRGWRVGRDVSVMGTDDLPQAMQMHPPATTVHNPRETIVEQAFEVLRQRVQRDAPSSQAPHPPESPSKITVEPNLIVRESVGPAGASRLSAEGA